MMKLSRYAKMKKMISLIENKFPDDSDLQEIDESHSDSANESEEALRLLAFEIISFTSILKISKHS